MIKNNETLNHEGFIIFLNNKNFFHKITCKMQ